MDDASENGQPQHPEGWGERQTAPVFPVEEMFNQGLLFFQQMPGGGMVMKVAAAATTPQGPMPTLPVLVVPFDADGWRRFKKQVAEDGKEPSQIVVPLPASLTLQ